MRIGDQITRQEIRAVMCPVHGEFCESYGPFTPCRARIEKAIYVKHAKRTAKCEITAEPAPCPSVSLSEEVRYEAARNAHSD